MLTNPILSGFHADPCICQRGDEFFMAVSSFEWFPAVPIYHSYDLKHWELYAHGITHSLDLRNLPSAKGVWAPCLSYCPEEELFYLVYGVMNSMNARFFDVDNYVITTKDVRDVWSAPSYIGSAGFDASLFHDEDGTKWVVSLEWESRVGYREPGAICLSQYDPIRKKLTGYPVRIWDGGTERGCIEGPHIYKRNGWYYLLCAEGGTGYGHSVTMGRSKQIEGPYESDPCNPILTSTPDFSELHDSWFLKTHRYNPDSKLQKSGHGSIVQTSLGEVYMVHHCARPFLPELRCPLGRETGIQKMQWTTDDWLRLSGGGNIAKEYVESSALPDKPFPILPALEDFSLPLRLDWYAPRIPYQTFVTQKNNSLYLRGQESLSSLHQVSLLAKKLRSTQAQCQVKLTFSPEVYQHSAGVVVYYDNMNYVFFRKYYSQTCQGSALGILHVRNGEKTSPPEVRIPFSDASVWLKIEIQDRVIQFYHASNKTNDTPSSYNLLPMTFDMTEFSDEFCKYGEFTGAFLGLATIDGMFHEKEAQFQNFSYQW